MEEQDLSISEYITGVEFFHDRTDFGMLIPFMKQMEKKHSARYRVVVADADYESLNNILFLESNGQLCFLKPANYDAQKTKKFRSQIGCIENMCDDPQGDAFLCVQGRKLLCRRERTEFVSGQPVDMAWYRCESCQDCPKRNLCSKQTCLQAFSHKRQGNVRTEMFFICQAFNLKRLWMKLEYMRLKTYLSDICIA